MPFFTVFPIIYGALNWPPFPEGIEGMAPFCER
jgi:hypothetical protein